MECTILQAISELRAFMENKMGELGVDLSLIIQDLRNRVDHVTEVEGRISETEHTLKTCQNELTTLRKVTHQLKLQVEHEEGH